MASNKLLAAYLVVGADELKRETVITRLKSRLDQSLAAFNLDERTASSDMDPTEIAISLNTLPIGEGFRLVIIHEAEHMPKPVSETIVSYLTNPNPGCVLCLEAERLAKNTRLYKSVSKVGKSAVIDCAPLTARELPSYLGKMARGMGVAIDANASTELISRVGENTALLNAQLTTLAALCATSGRITLADVESNVARTAEVKPWEFLDCVSAGNATRAFELYRHMQNPSQLALLTLLTRRVRELICARSLIDRGKASQVASALGRQEWQVRSVVRSARRFDMMQLQGALSACATCERRLKGGDDPEAAFQTLVLSICYP